MLSEIEIAMLLICLLHEQLTKPICTHVLPMPCEMAMSKYDPPVKNLKAAAKHICVEIAPFGMWNKVHSLLLLDGVD